MTTPTRATDSRPAWLRVIAAQESGLVVVIVLIMAVLTVRARTIERADRVALAAGTSLVQSGPDVTATVGGVARVYKAEDGYELAGPGDALFLRRHIRYNRFLNAENLVGVAKDASFVAVMSVGMAGIIIMGGIDLSVGSIYALAGVLGAMALHGLQAGHGEGQAPAVLAIPVGLLVPCVIGAVCGALNGAATVGLRVHPFIITLGGMAIYRGLAFVITKGQSIGEFPAVFSDGLFRATVLGGQAVPVLVMVAVGVAGAAVLARTVFGRRTFAIGGNETAARYAGVPVGRVKILLYMLGGLCAGLSASMMLGYYGAASSGTGDGYELDVIAAAVVGGASLSGGRGSAIGAMLGSLVIQLINNAITVLEIDENYKRIIVGLAVVLAVVVDQAKHRLSAGGR